MNSVILIGRLTSDPELRFTQSGQAVTSFTLAVDKGLAKDKKQEMEAKGQPTADFIRCQAWGKTAETLNKFTGKGNRIGVAGRIQTRSYQNQQGQTVYVTEIIVERTDIIDFVDNQFNPSDSQGFGQPMGESQDDFGFDGFEPRNDDNIPF